MVYIKNTGILQIFKNIDFLENGPRLVGSILGMQGDPPGSPDPPRTRKTPQNPKHRFFRGGGGAVVVALATPLKRSAAPGR